MEFDVLITLGFDFNLPSVLAFIEVFLTIIWDTADKYDFQRVYQLCQCFAKVTLLDGRFLQYKPSVLAKCLIVLSLDFYQKNQTVFCSLSDKYFQQFTKYFLPFIFEYKFELNPNDDDRMQ